MCTNVFQDHNLEEYNSTALCNFFIKSPAKPSMTKEVELFFRTVKLSTDLETEPSAALLVPT